jgi:hypothetical protein
MGLFIIFYSIDQFSPAAFTPPIHGIEQQTFRILFKGRIAVLGGTGLSVSDNPLAKSRLRKADEALFAAADF